MLGSMTLGSTRFNPNPNPNPNADHFPSVWKGRGAPMASGKGQTHEALRPS